MSVTLYEFSPTRSDRVRWTLLELGVPFESIQGRHLFGSDELKKVNPQGKLPAILDDGRPLFESAAICTWLTDKHEDKGLGWPAGTWERALHEQWVAFILTEVEAHLWSTARNTFIYPEDRRQQAVIDQNTYELGKSLAILDRHFGANDYIVGSRFSVTDIILGFATSWAQGGGHTENLANIDAYNLRLTERPACPLQRR